MNKMGYIRHHAIVVTSYNSKDIEDIHRFAELCNLNPTLVIGMDIKRF